jgi:hypothetical protein
VTEPLAGVRAKIDGARERRETINRELDSFVDRDPETSWQILVKTDNNAGEGSATWAQHDPIPLRWSVYLGEFLYDLRSALDHLAGCLVEANNRKPTNRTEFPVFWSEEDFEAGSYPKTQGMSAEVKTLIESLQPYREWPEHPQQTVLWGIHAFCNADKHRLLHLADFWLLDTEFTFTMPQGLGEDFIHWTVKPRRMRLYHDAVIAAYEWDAAYLDSLDESDVEMHTHFSLDIALAERPWGRKRTTEPPEPFSVRDLMADALDYVEASLLPKFMPFFP